MKPELTQAEMGKLVAEGKTHIWAYNTLYAVDYSRNLGSGEHYLTKLLTLPYRGMGVTKRGRFVAMEPDEAFRYVGTYSNHQNWRHTAGRRAFSAAEAPKTQEALMAFKFLGQRQLGKLPSRWVSTILMVAIRRKRR